MSKTFDKSIFDQTYTINALKVLKNETSSYQNQVKDKMLRFKKIKNIQQFDNEKNLILLTKETTQKDFNSFIQKQLEQNKIEMIQFEIKETYEDLTMQQALQKLLPQDFIQKNLVPTSFETAGHIAHLNLFPIHQEYKHLIAQIVFQIIFKQYLDNFFNQIRKFLNKNYVLMDKNKGIQTVVNKIESLKDNIFRNPKLELIGGQDNYITNINEGNCNFQIDFSKVYWNSRLNKERERMLTKFKNGDVLCDMFCGVGPLAIRAAKIGVKVLANDLNPDCYTYLIQNIKKNKQQFMIEPYNLCAREFVRQIMHKKQFNHVYMNLPGTSVDFLDVFEEYLEDQRCDLQNLPIIHIYTFLSIENQSDYEEALSNKIKSKLKYFDKKDIIDIYNVRDVSASSQMYSVSFQLQKNLGNNQFKKIKLI